MTRMTTGTREYIERFVYASVDLVAQTVEFSFDYGTTLHTGQWESDPSVLVTRVVDGVKVNRYRRIARLLLGDGVTALPAPGEYPVHIKVTDTPEIPIIPAGSLVVLAND